MEQRRFREGLSEYLRRLAQYKQAGAHHDQIRDLFVTFLRKAFPGLELEDDIELEVGVKGLRVRGFIDLLYSDLIFEFKRDLEAEREDGKQKLKKYLKSRPDPERVFGFLTDGGNFEVYKPKNGELDLIEDEVTLSEDRWEEALLWLDSYLFAQKGLVPTARDIVRRFGEHSAVFNAASEQLSRLFTQVKQEPSVKIKYEEWENLLAIVYGSTVGTEELFLRHTYLTLLARLLAFAALMQRRPNDKDLQGLVDGSAFERLGIHNLVEEDFFAWVLHPGIWLKIRSLLRGLSFHLSVYDLSYINEDLLKELYQELVDPETRHNLGEFYTPDWLAELTLREAGYGPGKSLLDPACGSGTFLFIAVHLLRERGVQGEELIRFVFENFAGIDIHPLAVTISKVNFLLALSPELRGKQLDLPPLPIYMANSLLMPAQKRADEPVEIPVRVAGRPRNVSEQFEIPVEMTRQPEVVDALVDRLVELAKQDEEWNALKEGLKRSLEELGVERWSSTWMRNLRLMRWLVEKEHDTVWRFILKNAYRPVYLAGRRFDFVAGNPPWLVYRSIEEPRYQKQVKGLVFHYELLNKKDDHLFTHMELATLFYVHCFERYLHDEGDATIAFVMPRSVLTGAKQHTTFQEFGFVKILDLQGVEPLFNVPACVLISKRDKKANRTEDIPTQRIEGILPEKNLSLQEAIKLFNTQSARYTPPRAEDGSPYLDRFVQGATIVPRCFWFVQPAKQAWVVNPTRPQLETDPEIKKQAKEPWDKKLEGQVEADFLYATLLATHLIPFGARKFHLVVLPLHVKKKGKYTELQMVNRSDAVRLGKTGLAQWLRKAEKLWDEHKKETTEFSVYEYLNYHGKLTSQRIGTPYVLVYNASGKDLASCVITTRELQKVHNLPLQGFIVDAKLYRLRESSSAEEAHYLCAVLNSSPVNEAIKPHQTGGHFGERDIHRRPFEILPIPEFDPQDPIHKELAELSKQCHRKVAKMEVDPARRIDLARRDVREALAEELEEIDKLVEKLLQNPGWSKANPSRSGSLFGGR
jgi:hypothetical protein